MTNLAYSLCPVEDTDLPLWLETKKACYKRYVDQYYGGWIEAQQIQLNTKTFHNASKLTYFRKIVLNNRTVGFLGYDEKSDRIDSITIHMLEEARNHGVGSAFLNQIIALCGNTGKHASLKVFKTNPARRLYERNGFKVYGETDSHYLMEYTP